MLVLGGELLNISVHTEVVDNSGKILSIAEAAFLRALERCGMQAEG